MNAILHNILTRRSVRAKPAPRTYTFATNKRTVDGISHPRGS